MASVACMTRPSNSERGTQASSAAAVGVGARTSATKSTMVKSVSCPTPLMTGIALAATSRAKASSLKLQRSSMLPPPRTSSSVSTSARWLAMRTWAASRPAASAPWTGAG